MESGTLSSSEAEFVTTAGTTSLAGKEVLYRSSQGGCMRADAANRALGYASCIRMSENPTNRERSRHVDVCVHFLRDMERDGALISSSKAHRT